MDQPALTERNTPSPDTRTALSATPPSAPAKKPQEPGMNTRLWKAFQEADVWLKKSSGYRKGIISVLLSYAALFAGMFIDNKNVSAVFIGICILLASFGMIFFIRWTRTKAGKAYKEIVKAKTALRQGNETRVLQHLTASYRIYPNPVLVKDIIFYAQRLDEQDILREFRNLSPEEK